MQDVISIIIPVYNTRFDWLDRCIKSVISQKYANTEIIIVDDGSESNVYDACDEYERKYEKVRVVHKENGGLASARKAGQSIARGRWIMFVDSDDWIDADICSILAHRINEDIDLAVFGFVHHFGTKTHERMFKYHDNEIVHNNDLKLVQDALEFPSMLSSCCWKLFNMDFLVRNNLELNEKVKQGSEDLEFMTRVLSKVKRVQMINVRGYHYIMNSDSITNSFSESNAYAVQKCFIEIEKTIKSLGRNELIEKFYIRTWYALCASLISGFFNPNNGLSYARKKKRAKKYFSTELAKRTMKHVNAKNLSPSRWVVYICVRKNLYLIIYFIALIRGRQKRR